MEFQEIAVLTEKHCRLEIDKDPNKKTKKKKKELRVHERASFCLCCLHIQCMWFDLSSSLVLLFLPRRLIWTFLH